MQIMAFKTCLLIGAVFLINDLYSIHITTMAGTNKPLSDFEGKKILVVVLPVTKTADDSVFLRKIDSVSIAYASELSVIGAPSFEDGYELSNFEDLQTYYQSLLGSQVILAQGMYTRKASSQQHALFSWLTHKEENVHFDSDVQGARHKFFISEQGKLYGVLSPETPLTTRVMEKMMQ